MLWSRSATRLSTKKIVHAMTALGDMTVPLEKATLTGAIKTAIASPASDREPTRETYYQIGEVKNSFGPTDEKHGVKLSVGAGSKWIVEGTWFLTSLTVAAGAVIDDAHSHRSQSARSRARLCCRGCQTTRTYVSHKTRGCRDERFAVGSQVHSHPGVGSHPHMQEIGAA
jgi:hypothetical protein